MSATKARASPSMRQNRIECHATSADQPATIRVDVFRMIERRASAGDVPDSALLSGFLRDQNHGVLAECRHA